MFRRSRGMLKEEIPMFSLLLALCFSSENATEKWVYPTVDAVERSLVPGAGQYKVGVIYLNGNQTIPDSTILERLPLSSGGPLYSWRLRLAECRLAALGLFEIDLKRGVWPRVSAVKSNGSEFADIRVEVVEKQNLR